MREEGHAVVHGTKPGILRCDLQTAMLEVGLEHEAIVAERLCEKKHLLKNLCVKRSLYL